MIMPTKGPGRAASLYHALPIQANQNKTPPEQISEGQFDQVNISGNSPVSLFQRELVARISSDVRTAHTTGDIQRVKQEIKDGSYKIDAREIAARMLLEGDF